MMKFGKREEKLVRCPLDSCRRRHYVTSEIYRLHTLESKGRNKNKLSKDDFNSKVVKGDFTYDDYVNENKAEDMVDYTIENIDNSFNTYYKALQQYDGIKNKESEISAAILSSDEYEGIYDDWVNRESDSYSFAQMEQKQSDYYDREYDKKTRHLRSKMEECDKLVKQAVKYSDDLFKSYGTSLLENKKTANEIFDIVDDDSNHDNYNSLNDPKLVSFDLKNHYRKQLNNVLKNILGDNVKYSTDANGDYTFALDYDTTLENSNTLRGNIDAIDRMLDYSSLKDNSSTNVDISVSDGSGYSIKETDTSCIVYDKNNKAEISNERVFADRQQALEFMNNELSAIDYLSNE